MILSAQTIRRLCVNGGMIRPFSERTVEHGKTHGLSSCGYDVRVEFKVGDTHRFTSANYAYRAGRYDPGHTFLLAATMERFAMPKNVRGVVHDKSSWIRKGLTVGNTVIEPGWRGYLTLELIYHGEGELVIHYGDPIAQVSFEFLDAPTEQPYIGKYQDQEPGPQEARDE